MVKVDKGIVVGVDGNNETTILSMCVINAEYSSILLCTCV